MVQIVLGNSAPILRLDALSWLLLDAAASATLVFPIISLVCMLSWVVTVESAVTQICLHGNDPLARLVRQSVVTMILPTDLFVRLIAAGM